MRHLASIAAAPDLAEQAYERLLRAICAGELPPGARLTQEQCADLLNVSRQPVMHALRLLKKDGLVIDAGRRGLVVAPLDAGAVAQLYQVRAALDALAARLAASAGARLHPDLIERGRKATHSGRTAAMIEADEAFHRAIYEASGNPFLLESAARHWPHSRRAMGAVLGRPEAREPVWDEHERILAAINEGLADDAERLARSHGEVAGQALAARMQPVNLLEETA